MATNTGEAKSTEAIGAATPDPVPEAAGSGIAAARNLAAAQSGGGDEGIRARELSCVLFLGSTRAAPPHWNGLPPRTGDRVLAYVHKAVQAHNQTSTDAVLKVEVVDPLKFPSCTDLTIHHGNPTYYHTRDFNTLPADLQLLVKLVKEADCFLIVSPEYNHSLPPALTAVMNQVGCSHYANKVSGCVCYSGFSSAGGGTRCNVALRPYLSELGCLPVSKQVGIPDANKVLSDDGEWIGAHKDGAAKTIGAMLSQLAYFGDALATKAEAVAKAKAAKEPTA